MGAKDNSVIVVDSIGQLRDVGRRLKVLCQLAWTGPDKHDELFSFMETTETIVEKEIGELNRILGELSEDFEDAEYEPIEV